MAWHIRKDQQNLLIHAELSLCRVGCGEFSHRELARDSWPQRVVLDLLRKPLGLEASPWAVDQFRRIEALKQVTYILISAENHW